MIALLFGLLAQQGAPLEATIDVDADQVLVGGELVVTVRAKSGSSDPIQIQLPPFAGLELVARSERSEVSMGADFARTTVLELRLRGSTPGTWTLGPARVRQGQVTLTTDPVEVEVTGQPASTMASAPSLSPEVQRLLALSRPPKSGQQASVSIILSSASAFVGEQVDVVTAAWFPRELRLQLRRPPTVQTPSIDGVYSYPQRSPTGIAASRQVDGRWFDLFVVHQIIFPLTPGRLKVPPATLHYSVPLAFQFFSQEERYAVGSEPTSFEVKLLPVAGRPAAFSGGVGRSLTLARTLTPRSGRAGEPFTVDVVLRGEGNVALWPPPPMAWPSHLRAYTERVSDRIEMSAGRLGGTKTFSYLVIPDSARTAGFPALSYTYFDPETPDYTQAQAPAVSYVVSPGHEMAVSRASPAALKPGSQSVPAKRLLSGAPRWALIAVVLVPPLVALVRVLPRRRRPVARAVGRRSDPLAQAEEELTGALSTLVPHLAVLDGVQLESALRAAGLEGAVARHAVMIRDRIRRSRYGPSERENRGEILTETRATVDRLRGIGATGRVRRTIEMTLLLLLGMVGGAPGQSPPPEQLYERGALNAAALAFAQRAVGEPDVPAHWFNLGATRFRMGAAGPALAAWTRAERLAPRDPAIRRALRLVPVDSRSARALWVPPVTPEELWILAGVLWITGWTGYAVAQRRRWGVVLAGALLVAAAGGALSWWYQRPLAIVTTDHSLAISPHELAPAVSPVLVGSVVSVLGQERGWSMVKDAGGKVGWLPLNVIEAL